MHYKKERDTDCENDIPSLLSFLFSVIPLSLTLVQISLVQGLCSLVRRFASQYPITDTSVIQLQSKCEGSLRTSTRPREARPLCIPLRYAFQLSPYLGSLVLVLYLIQVQASQLTLVLGFTPRPPTEVTFVRRSLCLIKASFHEALFKLCTFGAKRQDVNDQLFKALSLVEMVVA